MTKADIQIRTKRMAMSSKIPWPRILAEGVAIVVSILLAFGIEAWWSNREVRQNVQENLEALREELRGNLRELKPEKSYRNAVMASLERLITQNEGSGVLSSEDVDRLIGDGLWFGTGNFSTGALESILQSDIFSAIQDGQLQRLLASLPELYDDVAEAESRDADFTTGPVFAFISSNGSYNQIANTMTAGRPAIGTNPMELQYRVNEPFDHSQLLNSDEFLGILALAYENNGDVVDYYDRLQPALELALTRIELSVP